MMRQGVWHKKPVLPEGITRRDGWLTAGGYVFLDLDTAMAWLAEHPVRSATTDNT